MLVNSGSYFPSSQDETVETREAIENREGGFGDKERKYEVGILLEVQSQSLIESKELVANHEFSRTVLQATCPGFSCLCAPCNF